MSAKKYVKKPILVEALQISNDLEEIQAFLGDNTAFSLSIDT